MISICLTGPLLGRTNFLFADTSDSFKGESTVKMVLHYTRFQDAMHFFYKSILKFLAFSFYECWYFCFSV
jgi:hypothetical protein